MAATDTETDVTYKPRTFRAPDSLYDEFRQCAAAEGAGPAEILRELMRSYVRERRSDAGAQ